MIFSLKEMKFKKEFKFCIEGNRFFMSIIQNKSQTNFMQKNLDENSYEKRIENIEKGKSYLKSNGFFKSKSNLFEDIQRFIYKR